MNTKNPFLLGNFAPVKDEITADKLPIIGKLPPDLNGMYVRNGPNPQFTPIDHYHWFDGDGMLHAVRLQDGQATYFNRYVQTQTLQIERQHNKAMWVLVKHDLHTGTHESHHFGHGRTGGEAVFAPRPNGSAEDDGWVMTFVYDAEEKRSELLILHAQHVSGEPVARILLPQRVPHGFHGIWLGENVLSG